MTYFIIAQKKIVELKVVKVVELTVVGTSDRASAEVVSKFWPDKYMARMLLCGTLIYARMQTRARLHGLTCRAAVCTGWSIGSYRSCARRCHRYAN